MKQWLIGLCAVVFFGMACLSLCAENLTPSHSANVSMTLDNTPD